MVQGTIYSNVLLLTYSFIFHGGESEQDRRKVGHVLILNFGAGLMDCHRMSGWDPKGFCRIEQFYCWLLLLPGKKRTKFPFSVVPLVIAYSSKDIMAEIGAAAVLMLQAE